MRKNLEEIIKIQKEIIPNFDEELFLLEEEYLDLTGTYPLMEELNGEVSQETIKKVKEKLIIEINKVKDEKNEK